MARLLCSSSSSACSSSSRAWKSSSSSLCSHGHHHHGHGGKRFVLSSLASDASGFSSQHNKIKSSFCSLQQHLLHHRHHHHYQLLLRSKIVSPPCSLYCSSSREDLKTMERSADGGTKVDSPQDLILREVEAALDSPLGTGPQAPAKKPLVMVISGPSGVGKDAVINRLQEERKEIHFVVTATTRTKRPGEIDGKDYFFLSKEQFESMIKNEELLEYAIVYGDFKGIPKQQVRDCLAKGFDVVLRVDVQGAATIRSIMGKSAVFIFLVAESEAALVKRLVQRKTETREKLLVRIATAREELKRMEEFDYVVVNADGQLEETVSLISHIIDAEKARVHQKEAGL